MKKIKGKFIVFEGGPGSGKTTQINLLEKKLGWTQLREPGGTEYGEAVRQILQEKHNLKIDKVASMFGYMTCRANLVALKILPMLENGENILLDRYWTSTYAYQGAEGANKKDILELARMATNGLMPDLFIYYDIDVHKGQERKNINKQQQDRYDIKNLEFFSKVRNNYNELELMFPKKWQTIDASGSIEDVHNLTLKVLSERNII